MVIGKVLEDEKEEREQLVQSELTETIVMRQ